VAYGRGRPVNLDEASRLGDVLLRTLDLLAAATVKLAARDGGAYDEVVAEWRAHLDTDLMGSEPG
jgi:hypothetical protein